MDLQPNLWYHFLACHLRGALDWLNNYSVVIHNNQEFFFRHQCMRLNKTHGLKLEVFLNGLTQTYARWASLTIIVLHPFKTYNLLERLSKKVSIELISFNVSILKRYIYTKYNKNTQIYITENSTKTESVHLHEPSWWNDLLESTGLSITTYH